MLEISHNVHFVLDLVIDDAILHKPSLFNLLRCVYITVTLGGELEHKRKTSLADRAHYVVFLATIPLHAKSFYLAPSRQRPIGIDIKHRVWTGVGTKRFDGLFNRLLRLLLRGQSGRLT